VKLAIGHAVTADELAACVAANNAVWTSDPVTVEEARQVEDWMRDAQHFLATENGRPVGMAFAGLPPHRDEAAVRLNVPREERHRGVGTALYRRVSDWARERGHSDLHAWVPTADPDGLDWATGRGFVEIGREFVLSLDLRAAEPRAPHRPDGIDSVARVLLQATLNGPLTKADHPAVPVSVEELARDAVACVATGARAFHLHPRDSDGRERLDAEVVDEVVAKVRGACGAPVGVSTGAWIEPDLDRRVELIRAWRAPDYASVNVSEPGSTEVMQALIQAGVGIEAGVWTVEDAERLAASGLGVRLLRILIEPVEASADGAVELVEGIHRELDRLGLTVPRVQHGDGEATWVLLTDAIRRGIDTRVGLEDTLYEPNGERTAGNEALVRTARRLGAGSG